MEHASPRKVASERVTGVHPLWVGALAATLSASLNALVLAIASPLLGPVVIPPDDAVTIGQVVVASAAGAIGAAVVFGVVGRLTRRPVFVFWAIAVIGLLLSFIPIALAGATGSSAGTLALMHVVAAATNIGLLTRFGRRG